MATAAQINANIENAKSSTGPTTEAGKAASSQNAIKHGLSSGTLFIAGEDPAAYYSLLKDLRLEHRPEGPTEKCLVEQMTSALWLVRRAIGLQAAAFDQDTTGEAPKSLAIYMRYQSTNQRAFYKALETLRKVQAETDKKRKDERIGFLLTASPEEFVAYMAEQYKINHNGEELAPEIIEEMLRRSRAAEKAAPDAAK